MPPGPATAQATIKARHRTVRLICNPSGPVGTVTVIPERCASRYRLGTGGPRGVVTAPFPALSAAFPPIGVASRGRTATLYEPWGTARTVKVPSGPTGPGNVPPGPCRTTRPAGSGVPSIVTRPVTSAAPG